MVSLERLKEYTLFHDCGKPYCLTYVNGKKQFPNHAEISAEIWTKVSNDIVVKDLILNDMKIHLLRADTVEEFCLLPNPATHLLSGIAELNSNAKMFGGYNSESFKIKAKRLETYGKRVCEKLYGNFLISPDDSTEVYKNL